MVFYYAVLFFKLLLTWIYPWSDTDVQPHKVIPCNHNVPHKWTAHSRVIARTTFTWVFRVIYRSLPKTA